MSSNKLKFLHPNLEGFSLFFVSTRRQCYFDGERQLKFFQIYTKANCELECLTNLTLRYCNCSAFFMPSKSPINPSIKILRNQSNSRREGHPNLLLQWTSQVCRICSPKLAQWTSDQNKLWSNWSSNLQLFAQMQWHFLWLWYYLFGLWLEGC